MFIRTAAGHTSTCYVSEASIMWQSAWLMKDNIPAMVSLMQPSVSLVAAATNSTKKSHLQYTTTLLFQEFCAEQELDLALTVPGFGSMEAWSPASRGSGSFSELAAACLRSLGYNVLCKVIKFALESTDCTSGNATL